MLERWDLRLWLCLSANWLCKGATCCILVFPCLFVFLVSLFVSPCLMILWGLEKVSVRTSCSAVCWNHGVSCRWSEHVVLAVAIKALYKCALKEGRDGNWKTRKPENHFRHRDTSGARSCRLVSLPALKPQAMSEPRMLLILRC